MLIFFLHKLTTSLNKKYYLVPWAFVVVSYDLYKKTYLYFPMSSSDAFSALMNKYYTPYKGALPVL